MVKNILIYSGTFVFLLILMTIIVYQQKKGEIEKNQEAQVKIADSIALSDSLKADTTLLDSMALANDSLTFTDGESVTQQSHTDGDAISTESEIQGPQAETEEIKEYKSIAKIYEKMKPIQAAQVLSGLTDDEKANILAVMKDRQAAKILSQMDPSSASRISQIIMNMKK